MKEPSIVYSEWRIEYKENSLDFLDFEKIKKIESPNLPPVKYLGKVHIEKEENAG